jgi:hypothetical protein
MRSFCKRGDFGLNIYRRTPQFAVCFSWERKLSGFFLSDGDSVAYCFGVKSVCALRCT